MVGITSFITVLHLTVHAGKGTQRFLLCIDFTLKFKKVILVTVM